MIQLGVNIDHVATLRQARQTYEPDPVTMVLPAEQGGADGITIHLREDRRHINDRDVRLLKEVIRGKMNLEMALTEEVLSVAQEVAPDQVTIVPEKRQEVTTEGGLDCLQNSEALTEAIYRFHDKGTAVSLFIDPDLKQVEKAYELGAEQIELHTGAYANAFHQNRGKRGSWIKEKERLFLSAHKAAKSGLVVAAGHGLNYFNIFEMLAMPYLAEVNIGHSIVARALSTGLERAVHDMKEILAQGNK